MGIFKELYRGYGIYWKGTYNVEGGGSFATIKEARAVVDADTLDREARDAAKRGAKVADARANGGIVATREGDVVTVEFPDKTLTVSIREYRLKSRDWEDEYDTEIVFA